MFTSAMTDCRAQRFMRALRGALLLGFAASATSAQEAIYKVEGGYYFGTVLELTADVDGDGFEDLLVGAPKPDWWSESGEAHVHSSASGEQLQSLPGSHFSFGQAMAGVESIDGDAVPDFIVGAPHADGTVSQSGTLTVFSGSDASILYSLSGAESGQQFSASLSVVGDLDGDGFDDFLVGSPGASSPGGADAGRVEVVSGIDGSIIDQLESVVAGEQFGAAVLAVADWDGDGFRDFVITGGNVLYLYSGQTRLELASIPIAGPGRLLADAGDVNADGEADVVLATPTVTQVLAAPDLTSLGQLPGGGDVTAVTGVGDVNGDGFSDVALGEVPPSSDNRGFVTVYSVSDATVLCRWSAAKYPSTAGSAGNGQSVGVLAGTALAAPGDTDGNGQRELVIGCPDSNEQNLGAILSVEGYLSSEWRLGPARRVEAVGDFDLDGVPDYAVTNGHSPTGGVVVEVVSGDDGSSLLYYEVEGISFDVNDDAGITAMSAGDANGDGWPDLAIGMPGAHDGSGAVLVLSGFGSFVGVVLDVVGGAGDRLGRSVSFAGDRNGDGRSDLLVGAPASPRSPAWFGYTYGNNEDDGSAQLLSGQDGSVLMTLAGSPIDLSLCACSPVPCQDEPRPADWFGFSLAVLGDVDGDVVPDFAVGAPGAGVDCWNRYGQVRVFSGATGSLLFVLQPSSTWADVPEFGYSLAGAGDVNSDGVPDVLVGMQESKDGGELPAKGRHFVYSGSDGSVLAQGGATVPFGGYGLITYAYDVDSAGDFDGDGWDDIVIGNPPASGLTGPSLGNVEVISGRTGEVIATASGHSSWDYLGYSVSGLGDVNGDGYDDIVVGTPAPGPIGIDISRAKVIHGGPSFAGADCNENNIEDLEETALGYSPDLDFDGTPDECQEPDASISGVAVQNLFEVPWITGSMTLVGVEQYHVLISGGNGLAGTLALFAVNGQPLPFPVPSTFGVLFYVFPIGGSWILLTTDSEGQIAVDTALSPSLIGLDLYVQVIFVEGANELSSTAMLGFEWP